MTPLAYFLIAVIPLCAVGTILVARLPTPGGVDLRGVPTPELSRRLAELDEDPNAPSRDRRRVRAELLRRGHGREPGARL